MNEIQFINEAIACATIELAPDIPLNVYLVKGANYAVWIDSGVKSMFSLLVETMRSANVADEQLHFVLHTHSHHDHIGCNAQLKQQTGCFLAAHPYYATWHADFERHYQEFARPFPHLIPDTPELREEVLGILDEPCPLDIFLHESVQFNLGGGVSLEAIFLPGHMMAEFGWFESATQTLILGDAVTGLNWPLFHSHLTVQGYRDSLEKIRTVIQTWDVERVVFSHFPSMNAQEAMELLDHAQVYIDEVETTLIRILAEGGEVTLKTLWEETTARMDRIQEFRSLNMVHAHIEDLLARHFIHQVGRETYVLR